MPRKARIDAPGALHHIIIRGIERRAIFRSIADREDLLKRLAAILPESETSCFAWAFIENHIHLLLKTGIVPIAKVMQRVLTGYAVSFNIRHKRHGQLFQNRYKSILCEEEVYFKELIRYIHLNPIRANVVKTLKELGTYPFCGHSTIIGKNQCDWQDTGYVLKLFGKSWGPARKAYSQFVAKGIGQGRRHDLVGGGLLRSVGGWYELKQLRESGIRIKGDERILGSSDFVEKVLRQAEEELSEKYRLQSSGIELNALVASVAEYYKISPEDLMTASKQATITKARTVLCYLAVRKLRISCADVARKMKISPSTVSGAVSRAVTIKNLKSIQDDLIQNMSVKGAGSK